MTSNAIGDLSFGLRSQALAILALLSQTEPEFAEWDDELHSYLVSFSTFAWYNGREKGVAIKMKRELRQQDPQNPPPVQVITFGEDRTSDRVFVQIWITDYIDGAPTVEELDDRVERGQASRCEFDPRNYGPVVDYILEQMKVFYDQFGPVLKNVIPLDPNNLRGFSDNDGGRR